ncbi:uncharacterized protein DS421_17g590140 [Arachis hypogaea]|nr:uncharacterized protein DS421_17g590140 [Arachis hypogaea]
MQRETKRRTESRRRQLGRGCQSGQWRAPGADRERHSVCGLERLPRCGVVGRFWSRRKVQQSTWISWWREEADWKRERRGRGKGRLGRGIGTAPK